jgi:hypothetical protein
MWSSISSVNDRYGVPTSARPTVQARSPIGSAFQFSSSASRTSRSKRSRPMKTVSNGRLAANAGRATKISKKNRRRIFTA